MTGHEEELIEFQVRDRIAYITLNRPSRLNALSNEMHEALGERLRRFDLDESAWLAILSGNGRAFCSGADVRDRQQLPRAELERRGGTGGPYGHHVWEMMARSVNHKPIIVAAHGYAIGSGLSAVLSADLAVASADCKFQVTETPRGLPSVNFLAAMARQGMGASATELCLTGRYFTAEEALGWDLINRVAPEGEHLSGATELAHQVLAMPPLSVRASVRHRRQQLRRVILEARFEAEPLKLYLTDDYRASGLAFMKKEPPPEWVAQ